MCGRSWSGQTKYYIVREVSFSAKELVCSE